MSSISTVNLDQIRYANCWEDPEVLLKALPEQASRILCIASGGDNALALLSSNPIVVHAIDLSLPQLWLTALKVACFRVLTHAEMLTLLGVTNASAEVRLAMYHRIAPTLSEEAQSYWMAHARELTGGILHAGRFEQYFRLFRSRFLPFVHGRSMVKKLLYTKTEEAQRKFFDSRWNTWRWRGLMNLFFGRFLLGRLGRDPKLMEHVKLPVGEYIRKKTEKHLRAAACTSNPFLHYIFTGQFGGLLPFYLRASNFEAIRANIDKLSLEHCDATTAIKHGKYDAYCLSNIFEYFSKADFEKFAAEASKGIPSGSRLLFWNLMASRSFTDVAPHHFKKVVDSTADDKGQKDDGFFYSRFLAEDKK